jgi:hypothetical protein
MHNKGLRMNNLFIRPFLAHFSESVKRHALYHALKRVHSSPRFPTSPFVNAIIDFMLSGQ